MTRPVSVVVVGIGGYGRYYAEALLAMPRERRVSIAGAIEPHVEGSAIAEALTARGVPIHPRLDDFFDAGRRADLAVIASPIHYHVPQSIEALAQGCDVLCDKPVGATIQDVDELIRRRDAARRRVSIGYQWCFADGVQRLKADIVAGRFGAPRLARTLCLWPRDGAYYRRNSWAGRLKDPRRGRWILDSPINNAQAHFIHNLFFLVGETSAGAATPVEVEAEAVSVFPIETFDTVACRARTSNDVEVLFYGSHAVGEDTGPRFELTFDDAVVAYEGWSGDPRPIVATTRSGRRFEYDSPDDSPQFAKLDDAIEAVRDRRSAMCGPEAARAQTLCVNGVHESIGRAVRLGATWLEDATDTERPRIRGLRDDLMRCYAAGCLPSEAGVGWARRGRGIDLIDYSSFPRNRIEEPA